MQDTSGVPLARVATIAGGVAAAVLASRGIAAVGRVALHELDYRAGFGVETWLRSLK